MKTTEPSFSINVDVANPGQFFACCGLLELAHRLWPDAEGWFQNGLFHIATLAPGASLTSLAGRLRGAQLCSDDAAMDDKTCPMRLKDTDGSAHVDRLLSIRLDWWLDEKGVGGRLKTWAGQQKVTEMSRAMLQTAIKEDLINGTWLDDKQVPRLSNRIVEPFYFDARRFSHSLDTGFSLDVQEVSTTAHPATEFLCFVGLQRFRPRQSGESKWSFEYWTWPLPLPAPVAAGVVCGVVPVSGQVGCRFSLRFRDDQKRYKAFGFANLNGGDR